MTRIRLDELPGFGPVGLCVSANVDGRTFGGLCLFRRNGLYDVLDRSCDVELDPTPVRDDQLYLDATGPHTADRLARYIAQRTGVGVGMTAPTFGWHYDGPHGGRWQLGNVVCPVAFARNPSPRPREWGRHWHAMPDMPEPVDIDAAEYEERVRQSTPLAFVYVARWAGRLP